MAGLDLIPSMSGVQSARAVLTHLAQRAAHNLVAERLELAAETFGAIVRTVDGVRPLEALTDATQEPTMIYLSGKLHGIRQRRTLAFELGQIAWHRARQIDSFLSMQPAPILDPARKEFLVGFAAELLIPMGIVSELLSSGHTAGQIARRLEVTEAMVLERVCL